MGLLAIVAMLWHYNATRAYAVRLLRSVIPVGGQRKELGDPAPGAGCPPSFPLVYRRQDILHRDVDQPVSIAVGGVGFPIRYWQTAVRRYRVRDVRGRT